jgi:outer membrane immunogenic protein
MKPFLLATTATALFIAGQAQAEPRYSWTGCYVGGHVGAGWGKSDISERLEPIAQVFAPLDSPIRLHSGTGFLGGAQLGCDHQFFNNWLIGAAADFSWANIEGQAADPFFTGKTGGPILLNSKTDWLATAAARVGYAWDRWMFYGKGGAAWAHDKVQLQNLTFGNSPGGLVVCVAGGPPIACNPAGSKTITGWTLGFGLEWMLANNWSAALEFDHYDFGTHQMNLTDPHGGAAPATSAINLKQRTEAVKLSLSYRFAWIGRP